MGEYNEKIYFNDFGVVISVVFISFCFGETGGI